MARLPMVLRLDHVRSGGIRVLPSGSVVHVCENPTVVEVVAARWAGSGTPGEGSGTSSGPVLVCTSGQASAAAEYRVAVADVLAADVLTG